jgi:hypothetical protein
MEAISKAESSLLLFLMHFRNERDGLKPFEARTRDRELGQIAGEQKQRENCGGGEVRDTLFLGGGGERASYC